MCSSNVREQYGGHIETPDLVCGKWRHAGPRWAGGLGWQQGPSIEKWCAHSPAPERGHSALRMCGISLVLILPCLYCTSSDSGVLGLLQTVQGPEQATCVQPHWSAVNIKDVQSHHLLKGKGKDCGYRLMVSMWIFSVISHMETLFSFTSLFPWVNAKSEWLRTRCPPQSTGHESGFQLSLLIMGSH